MNKDRGHYYYGNVLQDVIFDGSLAQPYPDQIRLSDQIIFSHGAVHHPCEKKSSTLD